MSWSRYAIYYTPPPGPLATFGANWLGWDAATGARRTQPEIKDLPRPVAEITANPHKYGFHGTLKPPFRLAEGTKGDDLGAELAALAAGLAPVRLNGLRLARLGRFLALVPHGETNALSNLAATVVQELDGFRAPASDAELARRRKSALTPRQEALLTRWGYPYVMDQFRFHLTLTGPLAPEEIDRTEAALAKALGTLLDGPFEITDLTLCGEGADGQFHHIARYPLGT